MGDRRDELFGVAGTGRKDGAAERDRTAFEDPPARREVIGKAVDDDLAGDDARSAERLGGTPGIAADRLRFVEFPPARRRDAGRCW